VKRNVRFGEYSPLNPANQVNSQPFLGVGEYDNKKKKLLELQRKEYMEYLSRVINKFNSIVVYAYIIQILINFFLGKTR